MISDPGCRRRPLMRAFITDLMKQTRIQPGHILPVFRTLVNNWFPLKIKIPKIKGEKRSEKIII